ncbi:MAG: hypothetical protein U0840_15920 [Gemmataceae bacterium]
MKISPTWLGSLCLAAALAGASPARALQPVSVVKGKYLYVENTTSTKLMVYLRVNPSGKMHVFPFPAGHGAYLALNGELVVASKVNLWAETPDRKWNRYKTNPLDLEARGGGTSGNDTFTYRFR